MVALWLVMQVRALTAWEALGPSVAQRILYLLPWQFQIGVAGKGIRETEELGETLCGGGVGWATMWPFTLERHFEEWFSGKALLPLSQN